MIDHLRTDLKTSFPGDLVDALLETFIEVRENYYLGKHEPSELNGGKFTEACVRILQQELTGKYVPLGSPIGNMISELRSFETLSTKFSDSLRLHIPRLLIAIYNIRNKRGVGHLGGDVSPNEADATLIVIAVNWVMSELYRIHYQVDIETAQNIIDDIVERKLTLVYDLGKTRRVLDPSLNALDQTVILLYSAHPSALSTNDLLKAIEYSSKSDLRNKVLKKLHKKRYIEYIQDEEISMILPPGLRYVEENHSQWTNNLS